MKEFSSNEAFVERVKKMTPQERINYMISAGIYDKDGKLTEFYLPENEELPKTESSYTL